MSFILISFGKKTFKDLGETGQQQRCFSCSTLVFYHLILVRTWFTYFFVRIFSYRNQYFIECPSCSQSIEISAREAKAAMRGELRIRLQDSTTNDAQNQRPKFNYY
jgi:hypothetical protein